MVAAIRFLGKAFILYGGSSAAGVRDRRHPCMFLQRRWLDAKFVWKLCMWVQLPLLQSMCKTHVDFK